MFNKIIAASLVATFAVPVTAGTVGDRFSSYYAFGDSLTDDGKFGALFPPSLGGRFSDGITYAEVVENAYIANGADTGNLALGGAVAGDTNNSPLGPLGTFGGQIAAFANSLVNTVGLPTAADFSTAQADAPTPGDNPLISVLFGGNDFFQGFDMEAAADSVAEGIREIANLGDTLGIAFDDFLVASLPDIGATPAFAGPNSAFATGATNVFNTQLSRNIIALRAEGINVHYFDSDAALAPLREDIANGGPIYGVLSADIPCTASLSEPGPACTNPETLLFADGVHPNSVAHQVTGDAVLARIAAVPLPASAALMLLGLAGLGAAKRRKA